MPINFVLEIILMASLGAMIYLVARAVPRISDTVLEEHSAKKGFGERLNKLIDSLPIEKADLTISRLSERVLRTIKLLVMRVDNKLSQYLAKFKAKISSNGQNGAKPPLFSASNGEKEDKKEDEVLGIGLTEESKEEFADLRKDNKEENR